MHSCLKQKPHSTTSSPSLSKTELPRYPPLPYLQKNSSITPPPFGNVKNMVTSCPSFNHELLSCLLFQNNYLLSNFLCTPLLCFFFFFSFLNFPLPTPPSRSSFPQASLTSLHVEVVARHQSWISAYKENLQNIQKIVITCRRIIKPTLYDKGINPKMTTYFGIIA